MGIGSANLHLASEDEALFQVGEAARYRFDMPELACLAPAGETQWLWENRVPLGMVTLIEGPARSGKSFLVHDLAARVTTGAAWPDGTSPPREPARCLIICRQDAGSALSRRLEAAGADREWLRHFYRFGTVDSLKRTVMRAAAFPVDLPAIEVQLNQHAGIRLIVIDPLTDVCPTGLALVETLHLLNEIAARHSIAVVATLRAGITFDSRGAVQVRSRWRTDAARCTWCLAVDPADDSRRLFVPTRMNFCAEPHGLALQIAAGRVEWHVDAPVDGCDPVKSLSGSALWLSRLLAEGNVPAKEVYRLGAELGYTVDMLKYAKKKIGAHRHRMGGFTNPGYWLWSLSAERPAEDDRSSPAARVVHDECTSDSATTAVRLTTEPVADSANEGVPEGYQQVAC